MSFLKKPASHHAIDRQCKTQASHYSNLLLIMVSDQPGILHLFPLSTKSISSGETTVQYALLLTNPNMQKKPLKHKPFRPVSELHAKKIKIMHYNYET